MKHKGRLLLLGLLTISLCGFAQTNVDYTSAIKNPSFESGKTDWTFKSMGVQNNSVFSIKDGTNYLEKWTGRGGAVGNGSVTQVISNLPPGNYELTAAAQNIQEDTPTKAQTGAYIFAGEQQTTVTVRDTYTVSFTFVSGSIEIGFNAVNATGNWIAVDNFRLTQVGTDLSKELGEAITHAESLYGEGTGKEAAQLLTAINNAKTVAANSSASGEEQANAINELENAEDIYLRANASSDQPLDMTSMLVNPSFETGDLTGWTSQGMGTQGNSVFSIKKGTYYVEKWTGRGGAVGDALLSQTVTALKPGRYNLKAAAQNIQEDTPTVEQSGACIFANTHSLPVTTRKNYTLEFVLVSDELTLGFKAEGASGNWLAVDNFTLEYISDDFDAVKAEFADLIAKAELLVAQKMNTTTQQALLKAIEEAKVLLSQTTTDGWGEAARVLEAAFAAAETSQIAFGKLNDAITSAQAEIDVSTSSLKESYQAAVNEAQKIYDDPATTDEAALAAITELTEAAFAFKIENGSGTAPTVITDTRFIRGATWAFGRSTVEGANIMEEGFCWSENPDPKVTDNRTTEYLNQAGKIYWLRDLKPATMYYMRAYAITKDYAVGYGDVIKFCTVPKGTIGHWYNNGGDEATNDRLNYAINTAIDYYWNNLSSIHGFGITVNYSPGTPTADCSYGGWMRVGESSSYQQVGTIMHESLHGIGVGTHNIWWSGDMRSEGNRGVWLGDRVTEAVRFWDNSATAVITGDDMHLWPYGCNGAHEDTHSDNLYCMMGILAQALNEDGLPGSGEIGYALPYYSFNHEEGVKYYIKNEDENRGLRSAYLVETDSHTLQWKKMDAEAAVADDAAAWYLTFNPTNQYYQLQNAKTGYYMTYASGIKTAKHTTPTTADNFHLMRGRVDVEGHRGYYIIHPESTANPPVLNATANGNTAAGTWSISTSAKSQRWLILTASEAENFDNGNLDLALEEFKEVVARIRKLAETPHSEVEEGADATLSSTLTSLETQVETCTKGIEVQALTEQARNAAVTFLSNVSVTDIAQPFDLTFMIENPDFDKDATTGWSTTSSTPGYDAQGAEFYEKTFNYYQILDNMPSGNYELRANAFQRPGSKDNVYSPYSNGTAKVTTSLYINSTTAAIHHICDDRQPSALFDDGGWGSDYKLTDNTYIPNCMVGAEKYFAKGLYDSNVIATLDQSGTSLRFGIKCTSAPSYYWTMFDHFRLFFYGHNQEIVGIEDIMIGNESKVPTNQYIYDLQGRRVKYSTQLKPGIYIINGKKVLY